MSRVEEKIRRYLKITAIAGLFGVFGVLSYILFYNQCASAICGNGLYDSDMAMYMGKILGQDVPYEFPYPIFFGTVSFFCAFLPVEEATAVAVTVFNVMSLAVLAFFLRRYMKCGFLRAVFFSYVLHFVSMCFFPFSLSFAGLHFRYVGVFTSNPWHNATYIASRPFSIGAFFLFARIMEREDTEEKDYIIFGLFMILTAMTKPSFVLSMLGVCVVAGVVDYIKWHREDRVKRLIYLGIVLIPTVIDMLYQYRGVFMGGGNSVEKGIGFGFFTAWRIICANIPLAVIMGIPFPLYVLIRYHERERIWDIAWMLYSIGFFTFAFLYEKGERLLHMNFSWGYMHGMFFLMCIAAILVFRKKTKKDIWEIVLFTFHVLCGMVYFIYLYVGGSYKYF